MNGPEQHPSTERLNAFAEKALDGRARAEVAGHLETCVACREEVTELRSLFAALSAMPSMAPSAGFADRVMSGVRVPRPVTAASWEWAARLVPQSTRGWAAAAALLALPALAGTLLVAWVMSQPGVTPQGLWTLASGLTADAFSSGWHWAWTRFAETAVAAYLVQAAGIVDQLGARPIGLAAVTFVTLTAGSIYVLYQNLFRPIARRNEHASYIF